MIKKIVALLLLSGLVLGMAAGQSDYGLAVKIEGRLIRITEAGESELKEGDVIRQDDVMRTGPGSYVEIRFRGKKYLIDEETEFTIRQISTPPRAKRKDAAKVDYIMGILDLMVNNRVEILRVGEILKVGDVVKTGDDSYAELLYGEKVIVKVAENTTLEIKEFENKKKTLKQLLGKIWVKARKLVAEKFEVETRFGTAGVRGTSFGVSVDNAGGLDVDCEEGAVYMRTATGEEIEIPAGKRCGIKPDGSVKEMTDRDSSEGFEKFGKVEPGLSNADFEKTIKGLNLLLASIASEPTEEKILKFMAALKYADNKLSPQQKNDDEFIAIIKKGEVYKALLEKITRLVVSAETLAESLMDQPDGEQYELLMAGLEEIEKLNESYGILEERLEELREKAAAIRARLKTVSTQTREYDMTYDAAEKELTKWSFLLSVKNSVVDFRLLEMNIIKFETVSKELERKYAGYLEKWESSGNSIQTQKWKKLMERLRDMMKEGLRLKDIIKYEKYVFSRISATRDKLYTFKTELEAFSSYTDSASLWIEQAVNSVNTGEEILRYRTEARIWKRFIVRYEGLRTEFGNYEDLIEDAKRRGIFYTSARIMKEYEEIVKLTNGFRVKKGCCLVTMNFGQLKRIFILLKNFFMTADGRSLL